MKISILSMMFLSAVASSAASESRLLNETESEGMETGVEVEEEEEEGNCLEQNEALVGNTDISSAWAAVEDLIFNKCAEEEEGCEEDKTGTKIIWTYDFSTVADSNETIAYRKACNSVSEEREVVHTMEAPVILSCTADTADHIPYEVHLIDYFQCTGYACNDDELPMNVSIAFAERVIDQVQDGVSCQFGPHSGTSAFTSGVAMGIAAISAIWALF